jgi:hypothetical protein
MRCTAANPIFDHPPISKHARNMVLPLIARPLHSCFPDRDSLFAAKTCQCTTCVRTSRRPGAKEVNTSQRNCEQGSALPLLRALRLSHPAAPRSVFRASTPSTPSLWEAPPKSTTDYLPQTYAKTLPPFPPKNQKREARFLPPVPHHSPTHFNRHL